MNGRLSFYVTRALKGIFEAGFVPGAIFCASQFYKSKEFSFRLSIFYASMNVRASLTSTLYAADFIARSHPLLLASCWHTPHAWYRGLGGMAMAISVRRRSNNVHRSNREESPTVARFFRQRLTLKSSQSWFYLPSSPTRTKRGLWRKPWYNESQEAIMVNVNIPLPKYSVTLTSQSAFSVMTPPRAWNRPVNG